MSRATDFVKWLESKEWGGSCHIWPYRLSGRGYPEMRHKGKYVSVHRFALQFKMGREIRAGYYALHTCDNPKCCNPNHLYEGTQKENMRDVWERHPNASEMRQMMREGGEIHGKGVMGRKAISKDIQYLIQFTSEMGLSNRCIARKLGVDGKTVRNYLKVS